MIAALIALKRKAPWLWHRVEDVNGFLFSFRYRRLPQQAADVLAGVQVADYRFSLLGKEDLPALETFLKAQPKDYLTWFAPHSFESKELYRLWRNPAFLMMKVTGADGSMAGYFFLRGFFIGRAFAGLIVDKSQQNQGIGTAIWASCADICSRAGLTMQATISPDNQPSMVSCENGTEVQPIANLDDGYLAVRCSPKKQTRQ